MPQSKRKEVISSDYFITIAYPRCTPGDTGHTRGHHCQCDRTDGMDDDEIQHCYNYFNKLVENDKTHLCLLIEERYNKFNQLFPHLHCYIKFKNKRKKSNLRKTLIQMITDYYCANQIDIKDASSPENVKRYCSKLTSKEDKTKCSKILIQNNITNEQIQQYAKEYQEHILKEKPTRSKILTKFTFHYEVAKFISEREIIYDFSHNSFTSVIIQMSDAGLNVFNIFRNVKKVYALLNAHLGHSNTLKQMLLDELNNEW